MVTSPDSLHRATLAGNQASVCLCQLEVAVYAVTHLEEDIKHYLETTVCAPPSSSSTARHSPLAVGIRLLDYPILFLNPSRDGAKANTLTGELLAADGGAGVAFDTARTCLFTSESESFLASSPLYILLVDQSRPHNPRLLATGSVQPSLDSIYHKHAVTMHSTLGHPVALVSCGLRLSRLCLSLLAHLPHLSIPADTKIPNPPRGPPFGILPTNGASTARPSIQHTPLDGAVQASSLGNARCTSCSELGTHTGCQHPHVSGPTSDPTDRCEHGSEPEPAPPDFHSTRPAQGTASPGYLLTRQISAPADGQPFKTEGPERRISPRACLIRVPRPVQSLKQDPGSIGDTQNQADDRQNGPSTCWCWVVHDGTIGNGACSGSVSAPNGRAIQSTAWQHLAAGCCPGGQALYDNAAPTVGAQQESNCQSWVSRPTEGYVKGQPPALFYNPDGDIMSEKEVLGPRNGARREDAGARCKVDSLQWSLQAADGCCNCGRPTAVERMSTAISGLEAHCRAKGRPARATMQLVTCTNLEAVTDGGASQCREAVVSAYGTPHSSGERCDKEKKRYAERARRTAIGERGMHLPGPKPVEGPQEAAAAVLDLGPEGRRSGDAGELPAKLGGSEVEADNSSGNVEGGSMKRKSERAEGEWEPSIERWRKGEWRTANKENGGNIQGTNLVAVLAQELQRLCFESGAAYNADCNCIPQHGTWTSAGPADCPQFDPFGSQRWAQTPNDRRHCAENQNHGSQRRRRRQSVGSEYVKECGKSNEVGGAGIGRQGKVSGRRPLSGHRSGTARRKASAEVDHGQLALTRRDRDGTRQGRAGACSVSDGVQDKVTYVDNGGEQDKQGGRLRDNNDSAESAVAWQYAVAEASQMGRRRRHSQPYDDSDVARRSRDGGSEFDRLNRANGGRNGHSSGHHSGKRVHDKDRSGADRDKGVRSSEEAQLPKASKPRERSMERRDESGDIASTGDSDARFDELVLDTREGRPRTSRVLPIDDGSGSSSTTEQKRNLDAWARRQSATGARRSERHLDRSPDSIFSTSRQIHCRHLSQGDYTHQVAGRISGSGESSARASRSCGSDIPRVLEMGGTPTQRSRLSGNMLLVAVSRGQLVKPNAPGCMSEEAAERPAGNSQGTPRSADRRAVDARAPKEGQEELLAESLRVSKVGGVPSEHWGRSRGGGCQAGADMEMKQEIGRHAPDVPPLALPVQAQGHGRLRSCDVEGRDAVRSAVGPGGSEIDLEDSNMDRIPPPAVTEMASGAPDPSCNGGLPSEAESMRDELDEPVGCVAPVGDGVIEEERSVAASQTPTEARIPADGEDAEVVEEGEVAVHDGWNDEEAFSCRTEVVSGARGTRSIGAPTVWKSNGQGSGGRDERARELQSELSTSVCDPIGEEIEEEETDALSSMFTGQLARQEFVEGRNSGSLVEWDRNERMARAGTNVGRHRVKELGGGEASRGEPFRSDHVLQFDPVTTTNRGWDAGCGSKGYDSHSAAVRMDARMRTESVPTVSQERSAVSEPYEDDFENEYDDDFEES